jgi:hypothetical protein
MKRMIDEDISDCKTGMPWRKLDTCFKWTALQEYMLACGVTPGDEAYATVRRLLQARDMAGVEYDSDRRVVLSINHAHEHCVQLDKLSSTAKP